MWLQDGQLWLSASDVLPLGGLPATGNTSAQPESKPSDNSPSPENNPPQPSVQSAVLWLRKMREIGAKSSHGQALALRRASLTVLCLMSLQACSLLNFKQPEAAPKCPIVQCLDRALMTCAGIQAPPEIKTCADAVLIASDALGEVVVCQEAHRELIRCVDEFNRNGQ
jgi:hypothetical protein